MKSKSPEAQAKFQIILSMVIFGTIGLVRRYIPYSSALIACARAIIGTIFLLLRRTVGKKPFPGEAIRDHIGILAASGIALGFNWILLFEAYRFTSISVATIAYYMAPVFVILASPLIFGEKITLQKGLCTVAALGGMVLVSGVWQTGLSGLTGILFGLGAAVLYATVVVLNKKTEGIPAADRTLILLAFAAVALVPYVLITEDFAALDPTPQPLIMLIIAGIIHTGMAYALYFGGLPHVRAQTAALLSYIDPVVAIFLSVIVLHERLSLHAAIGAVLVLGAVIVSELNLGKTKNR